MPCTTRTQRRPRRCGVAHEGGQLLARLVAAQAVQIDLAPGSPTGRGAAGAARRGRCRGGGSSGRRRCAAAIRRRTRRTALRAARPARRARAGAAAAPAAAGRTSARPRVAQRRAPADGCGEQRAALARCSAARCARRAGAPQLARCSARLRAARGAHARLRRRPRRAELGARLRGFTAAPARRTTPPAPRPTTRWSSTRTSTSCSAAFSALRQELVGARRLGRRPTDGCARGPPPRRSAPARARTHLARVDAGLRQRAAEHLLDARAGGAGCRGTAPRTPRAARPPSCSATIVLAPPPGESNTGARRSCCASARRAISITAASSARLAGPRPLMPLQRRRRWRVQQAGEAAEALEQRCAPAAARPGRASRCAAAAPAARRRPAPPGRGASSFSRGRASGGRSFSDMAWQCRAVGIRRAVRSDPARVSSQLDSATREHRPAGVLPDPALPPRRPRRRATSSTPSPTSRPRCRSARGELAPAIEARLLGLRRRRARDASSCAAGEAFGERNPELLQRVKRCAAARAGRRRRRATRVGDVVQFPTPDGQGRYAGVVREVRRRLAAVRLQPPAGRPAGDASKCN